MTYSKNEDVLKNTISIAPTDSIVPTEGSRETILKRSDSIRLYGPSCGGCERHRKAAMFSFRYENGDGDRPIKDIFLNKEQALALIEETKKLNINQSNVIELSGSYLFRVELLLDDTIIYLQLTHEMLSFFLADLKNNTDEILGYKDPEYEETPRRLTEKEIEANAASARAFLDEYYKPDISNIDLSDVDMGTLIAALYNNALTGGMGTQHFNDRPMSPEEGRHVLSEIERIGALPEIDYINGQSIKTYFEKSASGFRLHLTRFWDYNNIPFATVLAAAKTGRYLRLDGQGILDIKNEVSALFQGAADPKAENKTLLAMKALAEKILTLKQEEYVAAQQSPTVVTARNYQLSICGNGRVRGEVGQLIKPFQYPTLRELTVKDP